MWDSTDITIKAGTDLDSVGVVFNSTGAFQVFATATGYTTGSTTTNAAAPPVGVSATQALASPTRIRVLPTYPDSLRRKVSPRVRSKPAPPRR
jgi:lipid-binding SYLF domain-containing protein